MSTEQLQQVRDLLNEDWRSRSLQVQAFNLEAVREPLMSLRIERYKDLCVKREQYRHPKDKNLTDLDRKTMLEAAVADAVADYETVRGLEELVKERVDLIKLLIGENK